MDKPKKLTLFERELESQLIAGKLKSLDEVHEFALCSGFLPRHTTNVVRKLKKIASILKSL